MIKPVSKHIVFDQKMLDVAAGFVAQRVVATDVRVGRQLTNEVGGLTLSPFWQLEQKLRGLFCENRLIACLSHGS